MHHLTSDLSGQPCNLHSRTGGCALVPSVVYEAIWTAVTIGNGCTQAFIRRQSGQASDYLSHDATVACD